jgi:predicted MPP superfamily phosphohydrolase
MYGKFGEPSRRVNPTSLSNKFQRRTMGLRFNLNAANWVAHLTDQRTPLPALDNSWEEVESIRILLDKLSRGFRSTQTGEYEFLQRIELAQSRLRDQLTPDVIAPIREFLSERPWTALIVPSGYDRDLDERLCSEKFLRDLVRIRPEDPGLILQLDEPPDQQLELTDVFPAFRTALAKSAVWPGVLIWTSPSNSVFLPFSSRHYRDIQVEAEWVFSHLAVSTGVSLELLERRFYEEFRAAKSRARSILRIVHLSDLHIGSTEAFRRLPRVEQFVRTIANETEELGELIPVISGDLIDTPRQQYYDQARSFLNTVSNVCGGQPILVLGNHDVRDTGYGTEDLRVAIGIPTTHVVWNEKNRLGFICFNSVAGGSLARGRIGERQFTDIGNALDARDEISEFTLVGVLHHHPLPVERPDWHARKFYEKILGDSFEKTVILEDADDFVNFVESRRFGAVMHGHKHIPRIAVTPNGEIPVFGCGSSVGKVDTVDRKPYLSINVLSFEPDTKRITCRLLAERMPGAGLFEDARHEVVHIGGRSRIERRRA